MPTSASSRSKVTAWWPVAALVLLAIASAILYGVVALLADEFGYIPDGQEHLYVKRPILAMLACFAGAFLLYFAGVALVKVAPRSPGMLLVVVFAAVVFRVILVASTPIQEIDIYRYIWDGAVASRGVSPFKYSPQQVLLAERSGKLPADLRRLVELRDDPQRKGLRTALDRIHFGHVPTVYPLVSQVVFATADVLSPADASLERRLSILKAVLTGFELATIVFVLMILRHLRLPPQWVLIYAWCPLLMKETANGGHLDAIAVCLTALAALLLLYACFPKTDAQRPWWLPVLLACLSAAVLGLATGAKIYPLILAPVFFAACIRPLRFWTVLPAATGVIVSVAVLLPMAPRELIGAASPTATVAKSSVDGASDVEETPAVPPELETPSTAPSTSTDPSKGLKVFLGSWEMNDFLFLLVHENLRADEDTPPGQKAWFTIAPAWLRLELAKQFAAKTGSKADNPAFLLARLITTVLFLTLALLFAWRGFTERSASDWLTWVFLTVAWFWLLSPTQNPWYWTWALPFLVFARSRVWLMLAGLAMTYYLRFWLEYHYWDTPLLGTGYKGAPFFDLIVTWLEYAPWLLLLAASWAFFWWRERQQGPVYTRVRVVSTADRVG